MTILFFSLTSSILLSQLIFILFSACKDFIIFLISPKSFSIALISESFILLLSIFITFSSLLFFFNSARGVILFILLNDKSIFLHLGILTLLSGATSLILLFFKENCSNLGAFQYFISSILFILLPLKSNSSNSVE